MKWNSPLPICSAAALGLLLSSACQSDLPGAPSELTTGIVVYEDANFQGQSAHITGDISFLSDFNGPCQHEPDDPDDPDAVTTYDWEDCISSVRVAPGWHATLYRGPDYSDDAFGISADTPNLLFAHHDCPDGGLNDCVSSIRVAQDAMVGAPD